MARNTSTTGDAFADAMAKLEKTNGFKKDTGTFGVAEDVIPNTTEFISTGCTSLDIGICTYGGIPLGTSIELFGQPSGGKTTLGLRIISEAQKMGLPCALIDVERGFGGALGRIWLKKNGVDLTKLGYSNTNIAEDVMLEAMDMIKAGFKIVMIDSIGALVPRSKSIESLKTKTGAKRYEEFSTVGVASLARSISGPMMQLAGFAAEYDALVLCINQIRDKIGGMVYGDTKTTPGGHALEHAMGVRLRVERVKFIKEGEDPIGAEVRISCVKSKKFPPGRRTGGVYPNPIIYFNGRRSNETADLVPIAVNLGVITKPTARTFLYTTNSGEQITALGTDNMISLMGKDPAILEEMYTRIKEAAANLITADVTPDPVDAILFHGDDTDEEDVVSMADLLGDDEEDD